MPDLVTLRRNNVLWSISNNPVNITITRTEKTETEGHFTESTSQIGPFTVRIFQAGEGVKTETHLVGTKGIDTGWGLLADWQADLQAGPNVRDEFEVPGLGFFAINSVYPQIVLGQVAGYQAELEKVN